LHTDPGKSSGEIETAMQLHRFIQGITLAGSLLLPLALSAQDPA
jgi:hypothetical protein